MIRYWVISDSEQEIFVRYDFRDSCHNPVWKHGLYLARFCVARLDLGVFRADFLIFDASRQRHYRIEEDLAGGPMHWYVVLYQLGCLEDQHPNRPTCIAR